MAHVQIYLIDPARHIEDTTEDLIAVSRVEGGILVLTGRKTVLRVALDKQEAGSIAAKLAPHIP